MSKRIILLFLIIFLHGCRQEPMINLSEENQQIIETKKREQNMAISTEEENVVEETSEEIEVDTLEAESIDEDEESALVEEESTDVIDTSSWIQANTSLDLAFTDYLPSAPYQIKQFSNHQITYPNYVDLDQGLMQVESRQGNLVSLDFYNWGTSQLIHLQRNNELNPYINHLPNIMNQADQSQYELLLQAPLQVGTSWQRSENARSEITAIYQTAYLGENQYTNVLEVTSTDNTNHEFKEFYGQGEGFIASISTDETIYITENYHENRIINAINVTLPQASAPFIENTVADFKWQTNWNFASAFDDLFTNLGMIDDSITVQNVSVQNDVAVIDFTPGVVAILNENVASEQAVIASIVMTLADFFNVEQVRLTVNGNGMLANTVPYPPNGIYNVSTIQENLGQSETTANQEDATEQLTSE